MCEKQKGRNAFASACRGDRTWVAVLSCGLRTHAHRAPTKRTLVTIQNVEEKEDEKKTVH